jgi:hypothetical protein
VIRAHGTGRLVADVPAENSRMLELARRLGFAERGNSDGTCFIERPPRALSPVEPPAPGPARPG